MSIIQSDNNVLFKDKCLENKYDEQMFFFLCILKNNGDGPNHALNCCTSSFMCCDLEPKPSFLLAKSFKLENMEGNNSNPILVGILKRHQIRQKQNVIVTGCLFCNMYYCLQCRPSFGYAIFK